MTRSEAVRSILIGLTCVALAAGTLGCASGGGSQFQNTVYDTHRRVVSLDKNLGTSVTKLNETSAALEARVNDADQQTRELRSLVEENQVKLAQVEQKLDTLIARVYSDRGLSTPGSSSMPGGVRSDVEVGEPLVRQPSAPTPAPAPSPAPAPTPAPAPVTGEPSAMEPLGNVGTAPATAQPATPAPASNPEADYQDAQRSYANQDYATALQQFDAFLQRYPNTDNCANAQFWKAKCHQSLEQYQDAIGEYEKLRSGYATSTKVPYAIHQQAVCHARLGQTARAVALLQEVVDNYPTTPPADQAKSDLERLQGNS